MNARSGATAGCEADEFLGLHSEHGVKPGVRERRGIGFSARP